jgi:FkbM family methyltransferase
MTGPVSGSFQGQDRFVLAACGGQHGGFFIDSGASDGVWGSNTRMLETEYGWRGICIEPNDTLYARLVRNRRCVCLNCCLYDRDGEVEFLEAAEVYGGIVSHYEPDHFEFVRRFLAGKAGNAGPVPALAAAPVVKPARTIQSILREYGAPRVIDYWSLDTEGSELAILRAFPFDDYLVRFLTVEHNHAPARADIAALLAGHGFERIAELGIDDGYAWVGHRSRAAWRSLAWNRGRTPRSAVSS